MSGKNRNSNIVLILYSFILISGCNTILFKNRGTGETFHSIPDTNSFGHIVKYWENGNKRSDIDTNRGYHKYWYEDGYLREEGKVVHGSPRDYKDSIWKYYSDSGYLMSIETYINNGKVSSKEFLNWDNKNPWMETDKFIEGDPTIDKAHCRFHRIEKVFYYKGGLYSEEHFIDGNIVKIKCWNRRGIRKPLRYLKKHIKL